MAITNEVFVVCDARGTAFARAVEVNATGYIQSSPTPGTVPGGGRIIACLAKSSDKLTPACKKVLAEAEKK